MVRGGWAGRTTRRRSAPIAALVLVAAGTIAGAVLAGGGVGPRGVPSEIRLGATTSLRRPPASTTLPRTTLPAPSSSAPATTTTTTPVTSTTAPTPSTAAPAAARRARPTPTTTTAAPLTVVLPGRAVVVRGDDGGDARTGAGRSGDGGQRSGGGGD